MEALASEHESGAAGEILSEEEEEETDVQASGVGDPACDVDANDDEPPGEKRVSVDDSDAGILEARAAEGHASDGEETSPKVDEAVEAAEGGSDVVSEGAIEEAGADEMPDRLIERQIEETQEEMAAQDEGDLLSDAVERAKSEARLDGGGPQGAEEREPDASDLGDHGVDETEAVRKSQEKAELVDLIARVELCVGSATSKKGLVSDLHQVCAEELQRDVHDPTAVAQVVAEALANATRPGTKHRPDVSSGEEGSKRPLLEGLFYLELDRVHHARSSRKVVLYSDSIDFLRMPSKESRTPLLSESLAIKDIADIEVFDTGKSGGLILKVAGGTEMVLWGPKRGSPSTLEDWLEVLGEVHTKATDGVKHSLSDASREPQYGNVLQQQDICGASGGSEASSRRAAFALCRSRPEDQDETNREKNDGDMDKSYKKHKKDKKEKRSRDIEDTTGASTAEERATRFRQEHKSGKHDKGRHERPASPMDKDGMTQEGSFDAGATNQHIRPPKPRVPVFSRSPSPLPRSGGRSPSPVCHPPWRGGGPALTPPGALPGSPRNVSSGASGNAPPPAARSVSTSSALLGPPWRSGGYGKPAPLGAFLPSSSMHSSPRGASTAAQGNGDRFGAQILERPARAANAARPLRSDSGLTSSPRRPGGGRNRGASPKKCTAEEEFVGRTLTQPEVEDLAPSVGHRLINQSTFPSCSMTCRRSGDSFINTGLTAAAVKNLEEWLVAVKEEVVCMGFLGFQHHGGMLVRFAALFRDRLDSWDRTPCWGHPQAPDGRLQLRHLVSASVCAEGLVVIYKMRRIGIHAGTESEAKAWKAALDVAAIALKGSGAPQRRPSIASSVTTGLGSASLPATPLPDTRCIEAVPEEGALDEAPDEALEEQPPAPDRTSRSFQALAEEALKAGNSPESQGSTASPLSTPTQMPGAKCGEGGSPTVSRRMSMPKTMAPSARLASPPRSPSSLSPRAQAGHENEQRRSSPRSAAPLSIGSPAQGLQFRRLRVPV